MNALLNAFRTLRVSPIEHQRRRILIGYADTEGAPHRKTNGNSIWNMSILFRHVVNADDFEEVQKVYHSNHIVLSKNHEKKIIKKTWNIFNQVNEDIMNECECESYILVFWNAPHDKAVLKHYGIEYETVDALPLFKKKHPKFKSYTLSHVCQSKQINVKPNHTGYFDSKALMQLMEKSKVKTTDYQS